jgi:AbiTii
MNTAPHSRLTEARAIATELLRQIETTDIPVERVLLQAKRLARLLRDGDAQTWLDLETRGYPDEFDPSTLGGCLQYAKAGGRITSGGKYYKTGLPRLEADCVSEKGQVENARVTKATGTAANYTVAGATTKMLHDQIEALAVVKKLYLDNVALLYALKASIHNYVTDTLIALEFGDVAQSIFDDLRRDVDTFVRLHSPKAAEKLVAIAERMKEGNTEAYAEALTSCRRLLMTVADSVFPPSDSDWIDGSGKKRKVGSDNYKNRLAAFIESKLTAESTRSILENELEHLCLRLDAVYDKACKGVHADVSVEESRLAIIEAYIFIGEIARLRQLNDLHAV